MNFESSFIGLQSTTKKNTTGGSDPQEELFLLLDERLRLPRKKERD